MKNRIFLISTLLFLGVSNSFSQVFSAPILEAVGLDQAVSLRWDSLSETSAATFTGYRLYRARLQNGPFLLLRTWKKSSITSITRMFYDIGDDDGSGTLTGTEGIRNEVSYYYKLTAFADSTFDPPNPYLESSSSIEYVVPHTQPIGYAVNTITMISTSGIQGDIGIPLITVTNRSNFRSLFEEHPFSIVLNTINTGSGMFISFIIKDTVSGLVQSTVFNPNVTLLGDTITGSKSGEFSLKNVFGMNAFDVSMNWRFEQLAKPITLDTVILFTGNPLTNTPVLFRDTLKTHYVGLINLTNTLGEATYEIEFLTGGIDTFDVSQKQVYQYLNMKITDKKTGRILESKPITSTGDIIPLNKWATITYAFNMKLQAPLPYIKPGINKYYLPTEIDTATSWEFSNMILVEGARIVCDYAAKGGQIGRRWPNPGYKATCDFSVGDKMIIKLYGGVSGSFPYKSNIQYKVLPAVQTLTTKQELDMIRVVPNPYIVWNEVQSSLNDPKLRFDYLPTECTIRIYNIGLELVKTIHHNGGGQEFWNLKNDAGNRVSSQLFVARIETKTGATVVKKFSVIVGEPR